MRNGRSRGFTLVELLIVIVVIGVLATMMMLSSDEAVIAAKANNIIATLRDLRTAALAWHADHPDKDFVSAKYNENDWKDIISYLKDNNADVNALKYYFFRTDGHDNDKSIWYVCCELDASVSQNMRIGKKLAGRAKTVGLLKNVISNEDVFKLVAAGKPLGNEFIFDGNPVGGNSYISGNKNAMPIYYRIY